VKINTLIVDDNPNWRLTLSKFVEMNPALKLVGVCSSAFEAYAKLTEQDVDLLICDIEMPDISGLGLAKSLTNGPLIIFVTSHQHYALDCYEVSPVDFLLKPLNFERFLQSIEKVRKRLLSKPEDITLSPYFFIRDGHNYEQISYQDVLYIKAHEHFLYIITPNRSYKPMLSITKMEEQLKGDIFLRVHRSYLVHRSAIQTIGKNDIVLTNGELIPIGDQYRTQISRKHIEGNLVSRSS
jgi:two-component system response regulator LytT